MKKSVFLVLSGIAIGATGNYAADNLTAKAGIVKQDKYVFSGDAGASLVTNTIEPAESLAMGHANNEERLGGALVDNDDCPVEHIHFRCKVENDAEVWDWEYRTKKVTKTEVWGEPE